MACRGENKAKFNTVKEKQFYTDFEGWEYIRIPLIIPYEVLSESKNDDWYLNLVEVCDFYYSIQQIDKISVLDTIILIHSSSTHQVSVKMKPKEWFVIIPSRKLEICFSSELDFKE